ncbi:MAG: hypothetical protein WCP53_05315 [Verrucomicrobiota bacterium]
MPDVPANLAAEVAALRRLVGLASGAPSFAFALCNAPALRREIIAQVEDAGIGVATLSVDTLDPVAKARAAVPTDHHGAVFITGLELLRSEANPDSAAVLGRLNRSRERWRSAFPDQLLVFWGSEQSWLRILQDAPDFRAWISHELDFTDPAKVTELTPERADRRAVPAAAESARRAAALSERLASGADLPPLQRLHLIRELLRLAPAGKDVAAIAQTGVTQALQGIRQRASADSKDMGAQRDLMVALGGVADSYLELGDSPAARRHYQEALSIAIGLAARDPANVEGQRDLSVSYNKLGDVQMAQGDLHGAKASYEAAMTVRSQIAAGAPAYTQWQRDLSVSHNKLGDVQMAQGDLHGAKASYEAAMTVTIRLAEGDPKNTQWQRDLSVSHSKLGDVQMAQGDLHGAKASYVAAKTVTTRLAAGDPNNTQWQRDLSVSHSQLGDVQMSQGDLHEAEVSLEAAMTIAARLVAGASSNTEWQRDLFMCYVQRASVEQRAGQVARALGFFEQALPITEHLAALDPTNATWQQDLRLCRADVARLQAAIKG